MASKFLKNSLRWLPGAIISIALVAALLYFVDLRAMLAALTAADKLILLIVFLIGYLWLAVRAVVWRTLLKNRASYREVFLTMCEGYLLNNFLPFRLGEVGRAFLLSRKSDLRFAEILPTIVIERVFDLGFTAAIFIAAIPFVVGAQGADQIAIVIGALVIAGLFVLFLIARNRVAALDLFHRLSARFPALQKMGGHLLESFIEGLAVMTDIRLFLRFLVLMAFNWLIAIAQYALLARAFFPQAQIVWGMFVLGAAAFGGALPSLPGGVGTLDGALAGALTALSHDQSTAFAAALVSRLLLYLGSGPFGLFALSREGQTLGGIYRQLMNMREREIRD
jgi:hypothetical protein